MYRRVIPEQKSKFHAISRAVSHAHPEGFSYRTGAYPHVAILPYKPVAKALGLDRYEDKERIKKVRKRIERDLPPTKSQRASGICAVVDFFGNHLSLVFESKTVSEEARLAYRALGAIARQPDLEPDQPLEIVLGEAIDTKNDELMTAMLGTARAACDRFLPSNRIIVVEAVSLGLQEPASAQTPA